MRNLWKKGLANVFFTGSFCHRILRNTSRCDAAELAPGQLCKKKEMGRRVDKFFFMGKNSIQIIQSFPFLQRIMLDLFMNIHAHMHVSLFGIGLCPPKTDIFQRIWE